MVDFKISVKLLVELQVNLRYELHQKSSFTTRLDENSLFPAFQKVLFNNIIQNRTLQSTHSVNPTNNYTLGSLAHVCELSGTHRQKFVTGHT